MAKYDNYFKNASYDVRFPFLLISIGKYNLTPVPQKYLKSFKCSRLDNSSAGTFSMELVSPTNAFEKGQGDNFATILEYLMSLTLNVSDDSSNSDAKINIIYGWQNGAKNLIKDGIITGLKFNSTSGSDNMLTCSVSGTTPTVFTNCFSKNMYERLTTLVDDFEDAAGRKNKSIDTSDPESVMHYPQDVNTYVSSGSITTFTSECPSISYLIEKLAKYLFGDYYQIKVDHVDKEYDVGENVCSTVFGSTNLDMSSMTLFEYLKKLVENCKQDISRDTAYNYKESSNVSPITINGKKYIPTADVALTFADYDQQAYADYFNGWELSKGVIYQSQGNKGSPIYIGDTYRIKTLDGKEYTIREVNDEDLSARAITTGQSAPSYRMIFGKQTFNSTVKPILKISPATNEDPIATFTINNNTRDSDVISFNISSDAMAGISAISSLNKSGSTADIDVKSGSPTLVTTDLGGLIPLSDLDAEDLKDRFISKLADMLSNDTSEATLTVIASEKSNGIDLIDSIRVYPMVNNAKTFWCGDYDVMGIEDSVDENGFTTTFTLNFKKCTVYSTFNKTAINMDSLKFSHKKWLRGDYED